jgi:chaperonin cofactor prefoldin
MSQNEGTAAARQRLLKEVAELRNQAAPASLEKKQLEAALSDLKSRLRIAGGRRLSPHEYHAICNEQISCKRRIARLETQLQESKKLLRTKHAELDALEPTTFAEGERMGLRAEMRRLRDHWQMLAVDETKDEKSRGMAGEFAVELRELLAMLRATSE